MTNKTTKKYSIESRIVHLRDIRLMDCALCCAPRTSDWGKWMFPMEKWVLVVVVDDVSNIPNSLALAHLVQCSRVRHSLACACLWVCVKFKHLCRNFQYIIHELPRSMNSYSFYYYSFFMYNLFNYFYHSLVIVHSLLNVGHSLSLFLSLSLSFFPNTHSMHTMRSSSSHACGHIGMVWICMENGFWNSWAFVLVRSFIIWHIVFWFALICFFCGLC